MSVQPGRIEAFEQTPLFAKLPAYVEKLNKDIGDQVDAGKPLADLWIPELHDEAAQKKAMVDYAKAGVRQATTAVSAAEKAVATADAKLREARAGTIRTQVSMSGGSRSMRGSSSWRPARASIADGLMKRGTSSSAAEAARGSRRQSRVGRGSPGRTHRGRGKSQGRSERGPGRRRQCRGGLGPH